MDTKWINEKGSEYRRDIRNRITKLEEEIRGTDKLHEEEKERICAFIENVYSNREAYKYFTKMSLRNKLVSVCELSKFNTELAELIDYVDSLDISALACWVNSENPYESFKDTFWMDFDGDILITDPCYFIRQDEVNDWERSDYGYDLYELGFSTYLVQDNLYGDWDCVVRNSDTDDLMGRFCADAGLVCCVYLDEVLKYNPLFMKKLEKKNFLGTVIKNFRGKVQFKINYVTGQYEKDTEYYEKGEVWEDCTLHVVGEGVDSVTGEPIRFFSRQVCE